MKMWSVRHVAWGGWNKVEQFYQRTVLFWAVLCWCRVIFLGSCSQMQHYPLGNVLAAGPMKLLISLPESLNLPSSTSHCSFFSTSLTLYPQSSHMQFWLLMHVSEMISSLIVNARRDCLYTSMFVLSVRYLCAPAPPHQRHQHCTCRVKWECTSLCFYTSR